MSVLANAVFPQPSQNPIFARFRTGIADLPIKSVESEEGRFLSGSEAGEAVRY